MTFLSFARIAALGATIVLAGSPAFGQYQVYEPASGAEGGGGYAWSVRVTAGEVVLTGDVPYQSVKDVLIARAGGDAVDRMGIAEGAPLGFLVDAIKAVEASALIEDGTVRFADGTWTVSGTLEPEADREELAEILGALTSAGDPWVLDLEPDEADEELGAAEEVDHSLEPSSLKISDDSYISDGGDESNPVPEDQSSPLEAAQVDEEHETGENSQAEQASRTMPADAAPAAENERAVVDPDYTFSAQLTGDGLVFSGHVPDANTRLLAGNMTDGLDGVADLVIAEGAPEDFTLTAFAGIAALEHLESGSVSLEDGQWRIAGQAAIDSDSRAAAATLERLSDAELWEVEITAPTAVEICRDRVEAYMADRAILFGSGSTRLTADTEAELSGIAEIFAICPSAPVYVEGHTDAVGRPENNLILSLSRAEAVVDALVDLGIDPQRLYAVGYGDSLPVASNETADGRAQNRRIVFRFEDIAGEEEGDES